jgi:hypothetical protein
MQRVAQRREGRLVEGFAQRQMGAEGCVNYFRAPLSRALSIARAPHAAHNFAGASIPFS